MSTSKKKQKDQEEMETKKAVEIYEQMKKTCPDFANALVTTERLEKAIKQAVDKQFKMKKQKKSIGFKNGHQEVCLFFEKQRETPIF